MTKTGKATLTALIAFAVFVAIPYLVPKWVKDTVTLLLLLPLILYGLGKYFAWCWGYWRRWRRQAEGDAAGEV